MKRETILTFAADEDRDADLAARVVDLRATLTDFRLELEAAAVLCATSDGGRDPLTRLQELAASFARRMRPYLDEDQIP